MPVDPDQYLQSFCTLARSRLRNRLRKKLFFEKTFLLYLLPPSLTYLLRLEQRVALVQKLVFNNCCRLLKRNKKMSNYVRKRVSLEVEKRFVFLPMLNANLIASTAAATQRENYFASSSLPSDRTIINCSSSSSNRGSDGGLFYPCRRVVNQHMYAARCKYPGH